jgi:translocation and assembly module TamB
MDLDGTTDVTVVFDDIGAPLTPDAVDVSGQIQLGPSTVRGVALSFANVAGEMSNGVLLLTTASAEGPSVRANLSGTAALGSTGESALKVELRSDDLRPIGDIIGRPISGAAELTAEVTGPATHPHATGTLNGRSVGYGHQATALTVSTSFTADMANRNVAELSVNATTESAFVKAGGFEFIRATVSNDWAHGELVVDGVFEEEDRILGLTGVLALQEKARRVTLRRLEVATGDATWSLPTGREARVDFIGDRLTIDGFLLARDAQQIRVTGSLPFEGAAPGTGIDVDVVDVQLADVNRLLVGSRRLEGIVNGDVRVGGSVKRPSAEATITISKGAVEGVTFEGVRADVHYADRVARIEAALTQAAGAELTVAGTVPVAAPADDENATLDLQVKSSPIPLGLVQALTSELDGVGGTGTFDIHVTGTTTSPIVDGTVAIDGGAFTVTGTGVPYRDLVARLRFDQNRLQIADFSIADADGRTLRVAGGVDLASSAGSARRFDVTFMADGFSVLDNELGTIRVDAILTAQGDFASPRLAGNVRIAEGLLDASRILELTTTDLYSTTPIEPADDAEAPPVEGMGDEVARALDTVVTPPQPQPSLLNRVDLDLHVRLPDNVVIRGRDLRAGRSSMGLGDMNVVAGGSLTVRKASNGPTNLVGDMQILRGYYSFQGRRFDVRPESAVRFRGLSPIDPALDVAADRPVSGVTASVEVQGTLREPQIDLSSQPPLDDADILALIIFGQPVNELGTSQRTSLSERAAAMAAGAIATPITDSVARALNLDLFEIQPIAGEAATVSIGTQIGSRLYVGVRQQVGQGDSSALSIEYRIASFLRLVTSIVHGAMDAHVSDRYDQSGADMIFTWRH